ncbi:MAG: hypothetical protein ACMXYK_03305 [Candidatus Woesearchaeota archaeon]
MRGQLVAIYGPMFASKTTTLLKYTDFVPNIKDIQFFNTATDTRYGRNGVYTHSGKSFPAIPFTDIEELIPHINKSHLFFDEVNFYPSEFVPFIEYLLQEGRNIVISGLDKTSEGDFFPLRNGNHTMKDIIGRADIHFHKKGVCLACQGEATHTAYIGLDQKGSAIKVGVDDYCSLCETDWDKYRNNEILVEDLRQKKLNLLDRLNLPKDKCSFAK